MWISTAIESSLGHNKLHVFSLPRSLKRSAAGEKIISSNKKVTRSAGCHTFRYQLSERAVAFERLSESMPLPSSTCGTLVGCVHHVAEVRVSWEGVMY